MDKILISSGWFQVRLHHKLTDQSESTSHDLDPFWPVETLFNVVSTKICSHLFRYDSEPLVNFMCCRDISIDTLSTGKVIPHLLIPGSRYPVCLLERFKNLALGHYTANLLAEGRRLVSDFQS